MSDALQVSPEVLQGLAGRAGALAGDIGALGAGMPEAPTSVTGDGRLTAAVEEFSTAWVRRAGELADELDDAAEFLRAFADAVARADAQMADGAAG